MDVMGALAEAHSGGRRVALVTVLAVEGDAPSHPGAKLVADYSGPVAGGLGCSEFDRAGLALARQVLDGQRTARRKLEFPGHGRERAIELFAEVQEPQPIVLVVGANPVGRALVDVAAAIGRRVVLVAPDGVPASRAGVEARGQEPAEYLRANPLNPSDAIVLSDHDAAWVDDVLRIALSSEAAFVGMLGSRRHAPEAVARLRAAGVGERELARLHSPCGLDIGSRTPGEIALSIIAEIIAVERGRGGGSMGVDWSQRGS